MQHFFLIIKIISPLKNLQLSQKMQVQKNQQIKNSRFFSDERQISRLGVTHKVILQKNLFCFSQWSIKTDQKNVNSEKIETSFNCNYCDNYRGYFHFYYSLKSLQIGQILILITQGIILTTLLSYSLSGFKKNCYHSLYFNEDWRDWG